MHESWYGAPRSWVGHKQQTVRCGVGQGAQVAQKKLLSRKNGDGSWQCRHSMGLGVRMCHNLAIHVPGAEGVADPDQTWLILTDARTSPTLQHSLHVSTLNAPWVTIEPR